MANQQSNIIRNRGHNKRDFVPGVRHSHQPSVELRAVPQAARGDRRGHTLRRAQPLDRGAVAGRGRAYSGPCTWRAALGGGAQHLGGGRLSAFGGSLVHCCGASAPPPARSGHAVGVGPGPGDAQVPPRTLRVPKATLAAAARLLHGLARDRGAVPAGWEQPARPPRAPGERRGCVTGGDAPVRPGGRPGAAA